MWYCTLIRKYYLTVLLLLCVIGLLFCLIISRLMHGLLSVLEVWNYCFKWLEKILIFLYLQWLYRLADIELLWKCVQIIPLPFIWHCTKMLVLLNMDILFRGPTITQPKVLSDTPNLYQILWFMLESHFTDFCATLDCALTESWCGVL